MSSACIHTLEPMEHGGVMAKVRVVGDMLIDNGYETDLVYTATNQMLSGTWFSRMKYLLSHYKPHTTQFEHYTGLAFPYWPLPTWGSNYYPWLWIRNFHLKYNIQIVVSGASHCGLPVALTRQKYIIWVSTMYEDELIGRALAGDEWAQRTNSGLSGNLLKQQEHYVLNNASLVLANGQYITNRITATLPKISNKVRTVIYPVDTDMFRSNSISSYKEKMGRYLLFTGRINDPRKNLDMLFRSFARVLDTLHDVKLVLTGDKPEDYLKNLAYEYGILRNVEFVGRQTKEQLIDLYQGAEVFVLSSNQEGLGISILEAMSCGVPVVSTMCGGPEYVVQDCSTGYLVEINDDNQMSEKIIMILNDDNLRNQLSNNSIEFAKTNFSKSVINTKLLQCFSDVYPEYFNQSQ